MASMTIAQGLRQEGEIARSVRFLVRQVRKSLREPDAMTVVALESIKDVDRLERMFDAIENCKNWGEVLMVL